MRVIPLSLSLLLWVALPDQTRAASPLARAPVRIILDTDMHTDCDDAGALAVLHALADRGECEILATVVSVKDPLSAATVETIPHWPGPLVFVGREIGSVPSGLQVGANLAKTPPDNPVRMAYFHYFGGQQKSRHVADLTTVLYAVRGLRDYWALSPPGRMSLQPDTKFDWQFTAEGHQSFLLKKLVDGKPNDRYLEAVLDELLLQPPRRRASTSDRIPASPGTTRAVAPAVPPYPPSPIIAGMDWTATNRIVRAARDGDNWPLTWADDDALYTTWGDGTGFEPKVEKKLSLGFARVTGAPDDFTGVNVRSPAEQLGQGRAGKKGWGMLCVDGVLYLWLGHADNNGDDCFSIRQANITLNPNRGSNPSAK